MFILETAQLISVSETQRKSKKKRSRKKKPQKMKNKRERKKNVRKKEGSRIRISLPQLVTVGVDKQFREKRLNKNLLS